MSLNFAFDKVAHQYDTAFTHTHIGIAQRNSVWAYLNEVFEKDFEKNSEKNSERNFEVSGNKVQNINVLEITCGTGEDAIWIAKKGFNVTATDISPQMIEIAKQKLTKINTQQNTQNQININFQSIDFQDINENYFKNKFENKFDLVFSNFGGLNCASQENLIKWLNNDLLDILNPKGRFIAVIMPKFCLWESLYFLCKFSPKKAFRRWTNTPQIANIDNLSSISTWYHQPKMLQQNLQQKFDFVSLKGVGLFLPPSYLNNFFRNKIKLLGFLGKMEHFFTTISILKGFFARISDHYLIDFRKK